MCWWRSYASGWAWRPVFDQTLQILSVTLFEKTPILCALQALDADADFAENVNQLILFDL
jgi:hypothetical protein